MPVYRYKQSGLDIQSVKNQVPPADASSISGSSTAVDLFWDITALTTSKDDLDGYMASIGWTFVEQDPGNTPAEAAQGNIDHTEISNIGSNTHAQLDGHVASTSNPHSVTAAQTGALGKPAQLVTVAESGGDYTSIKAAVDSISDASSSKPYVVKVYPGTYTEDPITMKPYVFIHGVDTDSVIITASTSDSNLFTAAIMSALRNTTIQGPSAAAALYAGAGVYYVFCENCFFQSGQEAIHATGASANIIAEECKIGSGVTTGLYAASSGRIDCSNILSYAVNAFYAYGGTIWCHNSGCQGSTNAFYVNNGGTFYGSSVTSEGCTNALRLGSTGTNEIAGEGFEIRSSVTYDLYQENATGSLNIGAARLDLEKFSIVDWAGINPSFDTTVDGEERFVVVKPLESGVAEVGVGSSFGKGASYYRSMVVITTDGTATSTTDGGNLTDVSADARSKTGSTFSFQGVTANHTILIGSNLSDGSDRLKHWGMHVLQTTAAVEVTKRSFVFEIWNGSAWVGTKVMSTSFEDAYRYANEVFIRANSNEVLRYGIDETTTWSKKTISGYNLYWVRIRISTTVTTAPVFQQFKISPSHFALSIYGYVQTEGLARFKKTIVSTGNVFGEGGGLAQATIDVGSGGIPSGWGHVIPNSLLNGNGDNAMIQMPIPDGTDTSFPLYIRVTLNSSVSSAADIDLIVSFLPVERVFNTEADPSGGIIPVERTAANTETLVAKAASTHSKTITTVANNKIEKQDFGPFYVDNYYEGDIAFIRMEMDDDGSSNPDICVISMELIGVSFALGNRI